MKADYSIEFAHIYSDETFNSIQKKGIEELKKIIKKLKKENKKISTVLLVDEYNPTTDKLIITKLLNYLQELNAKPDFISFESRLIFAKEFLLKQMSLKLREKYSHYIEIHQKLPCSFLITIWYLLRLGLLKNSKITAEKLKKTPKPFEAKRIINILPKRFEKVEKEAIEIIKSTKFASYAKNIEYIFF